MPAARRVLETTTTGAVWVFDLVDGFERLRQGVIDDGPPPVYVTHPRPQGQTRFLLVRRVVGGNALTFDPPLELVVPANPSGYHVFFGLYCPARGDPRRLPMPPGDYTIRVDNPLYQPEDVIRSITAAPPDPAARQNPPEVELLPSAAYPFPDVLTVQPVAAGDCAAAEAPGRPGLTLLRGAYLNPDGSGVPGAVISTADASSTFTTGASGQWVLWFLNLPPGWTSQTVTVQITPPGGAAVNVPDVCVVLGRETSLPQSGLYGRVERVGAGVGGARITVAGLPGESVSRADGTWRFVFSPVQFNPGDPPQDLTVQAALPGQPLQEQPVAGFVARTTRAVQAFIFP